ncbi:helix-turn-helix domain-containing protein [Alteromonas sp. ASW11-36]|uniref:Helix-turn-helix domain-containing protein n=1 Tax=Alteromonas arenosi TaxID=3055817 RepID=A0ABT7SWI8_9ALTE|nr:helix-turn-helix domain-containing protein [Alteromonas sp. ASW11-36]MDM7860556.1 helix-turn-helix domain-containing protein [Alteromonas sp. ASW11-36]
MQTSVRRLSAAENRLKAVQFRRQGMTLEQIGIELGVSTSMVYKYIHSALIELAEKQYEETQDYRALQMYRLEGLLNISWDQAQRGDLAAVDKAIKIIDQLSKLMNLYAPMKIAPTNVAGEDLPNSGVIVVPAVAGSVEEWLEQYKLQTE